jgi:hypothetical protein
VKCTCILEEAYVNKNKESPGVTTMTAAQQLIGRAQEQLARTGWDKANDTLIANLAKVVTLIETELGCCPISLYQANTRGNVTKIQKRKR